MKYIIDEFQDLWILDNDNTLLYVQHSWDAIGITIKWPEF